MACVTIHIIYMQEHNSYKNPLKLSLLLGREILSLGEVVIESMLSIQSKLNTYIFHNIIIDTIILYFITIIIKYILFVCMFAFLVRSVHLVSCTVYTLVLCYTLF